MSRKKRIKKQHKQLIKGGVVAGLAIAGAFTIKEFNSNGDFQPFESLRKFNYNQVVFENSDNGKKGKDNASSNDSELWMQDKNSQTQLNPSEIPQSQYLFAQNKDTVAETNTTPVVSTDANNEDIISSDTPRDENGAIVITPNAPSTPDNSSNSTVIVPGSGSTDSDSPTPGGGSESGVIVPGGNGNGETPSDAPSDPGGDNGGTGDNPSKPSIKVPDAPTMSKVDPSKKPTADNDFLAKPEIDATDVWKDIRGDYSPSAPLPQEDPKTGKKITYSIVVTNQELAGDGSSYIKTLLCTGDTFSIEKILETIRVYIIGVDENGKMVRVLDVDQFGDNLRVDAVPSELDDEDFDLKFYFRPSSEDEWTVSNPYRLQVSDYRVVLESADESIPDQVFVFDEGDNVDLSQYYLNMIPSKYKKNYNADTKEYDLDALFPGWKNKDGEFVNSLDGTGYEKGQIDLKSDDLITNLKEKGYTAKWTQYGQTLTSMPYDEFSDKTFTVPDYINALRLELKESSDEDDENPLGIFWINELKISDSLKYMDLSYASVNSFSIDGESSRYEIKDGILYGKTDGVINEVLGIPFDTDTVTIPAGVTRVTLPLINFVETMIFEGDTPPDVTVNWLATGNDIHLIVPKGSELTYFKAWYKELQPDAYICTVQPDEETGEENIVPVDFIVENGLFMSSDRTILYGVENDVTGILFVPDTVTTIKTGAFADAKVTNVYLPHRDVTLEPGSLSGSLKTVLVNSDTLPEGIESAAGGDVEVKELGQFECGVTASGYRWLVCDGITTLLSVPEDLTEFNCSFVDDNGNVIIPDAIGPNAFSEAFMLENVILDKQTEIIGLDAFSGCSSLKIFLSYADSIRVQSGAFDGCNKLVYAVFNAREVIEFDAELKKGVAYCPYYSYGYPTYFYAGGLDIRPDYSYFWDNGLLYGVTYGNSGKDLQQTTLMYVTPSISGEVVLRDDVIDIMENAFQNCKQLTSIKGLENVSWIGDKAFYNSGLSGKISLDNAWEIREAAFGGCKGITEIDLSKNTTLQYLYYTAFADTGIHDIVLPKSLLECGADVFTECENAVTVHIKSTTPFKLNRWGATTPFSFGNVERLILEDDAVGKEQDYIDAWKYSFLALGQVENDDDLYWNLYFQYVYSFMDENLNIDIEGLDAYINKEMKRISIQGENKIRALFGMELLEEPEQEPLPNAGGLGVDNSNAGMVGNPDKQESNQTEENTAGDLTAETQDSTEITEEVSVVEQQPEEFLAEEAAEDTATDEVQQQEQPVQEVQTEEPEQTEQTPASESAVQAAETAADTVEQTEETQSPDTGAEQVQNEVIEE